MVEKIPKSQSSPKLYIATLGYVYPGDDGNFYPLGTQEREKLQYYASKFNSILIRTTFFGQPKTDTYADWIEVVDDNPEFKFIITAPKLLTHSKSLEDVVSTWKFFWDGIDDRGGCKILHQHDRLGCLFMEFPNTFCYSTRNANKLKGLMKIVPSDVRCAVEFRHWSWWENKDELRHIFGLHPGWCISTPYVENGLVGCGWAGNLRSTRVQNQQEPVPTLITTDFIFLNFYGTLGKHLGSYDSESFLERMVSRIKEYRAQGVDTTYCSFSNTDSSYCFPLPGVCVLGLPIRPKMKELPSHTSTDLACCLHDAKRFEKLWKDIEECPYQIDESGYVEMVFV
jgi:uncharacterized protein YecE (DUF72 family)